MKIQFSRQQLSLYATVLIAILLFAAASWRYVGFASTGVFINLIEDNAFLGVAAVGMTFVILSGGIDLSVGSMIGLTSILSAILIERMQMSPLIVIPFILLVGAVFGTVMGLFISKFDLAPFLVTLAGMFFARGLAYTLSLDSIPLNHPFFVMVSQTRLNLGVAALPSMSVLFLCVVAGGIFVSTQTRFGRAVFALGGNTLSAKLMGLPVGRYQILVYTLSGTLSALAGVVYTFYTSSGNATAAMGLELDAIAAVVVGGTLLSGGSGTVFGTLIGTLILGMIQTIITFESTLSSWWTKIVIGSLLFFFVVLQKVLSYVSQRAIGGGPTEKKPQPRSMKFKLTGTTALLIGALLLPLGPQEASALVKPKAVIECPTGQTGGAMIADGLYQLTGTHLKKGQTEHQISELPDPAPPYVAVDGSVEIYGSAQYFIRYKNWDEYKRGGCFERVPLRIVSQTGVPYAEIYTHPWDLRKYRVEKKGAAAKEIIVGGAMSASGTNQAPHWPDDNINRRIYFFRWDQIQAWVRDVMPIVGHVATGWLGHSYGGNLIQENSEAPNIVHEDGPGPMAFFYERVSDSHNNGPYKTEIFAVKMKKYDEAVPDSEVKILEIGENPYPSEVRVGNGFLVEGPRPLQIDLKGRKVFIIGFSTGDFPTDNYHINYMWSADLMGPYKPVLTADGKDLLDLGVSLKKKYGLSWVGRPSFYQTPDGNYEMLFHGVIKEILADNDYTKWPDRYQLWNFFRCIFKVKIQISAGPDGAPVIDILTK